MHESRTIVGSNDINIIGLVCSLGCPQHKTTKIYCLIIEGVTHSTFSDTLQHPRQLQQQTSGMQQQGLVASRCCKNLAARCFKEGTGNDIQKYMIPSRLLNVSDSHVKLFYRKRELMLKLHYSAARSSGVSLRFRSITDYLRGWFLRIWVSDCWWCPSTDRLLYIFFFPPGM